MKATLYKYFVEVPALSKKLRPSGSISEFLLLCKFWWFLVSRKIFCHDKKMIFRLNFEGHCFLLNIYNNYDFLTFRTTFLREDYDFDGMCNSEVIIDAGANVGFVSHYMRAKFPHAKIYALEPIAKTFDRLVENVGSDKKIITLKVALGAVDGIETFKSNPLVSFSSSSKDRDDLSISEQVKVITLKTLYSDIQKDIVDIFKFDIEGSEEDVFMVKEDILRARNYVGEVHGDLMSISVEEFMKKFINYEITEKNLGCDRIIFKAIG